MAVCSLAIRLPGDAVAGCACFLLVTVASGVVVARRVDWRGSVRVAAPVAALSLALSALPFVVNGRIGPLGVSINDDLVVHLLAADRLDSHEIEPSKVALAPGYPIGPHSVVASVGRLVGGPEEGFTALLILVPLLTALAALTVLEHLPAGGRAIGGFLVGAPYLLASYVVQGAFKETLQAALLFAFVVELRERTRRSTSRPREAIPLGVLAAGSIYTYSYPGLYWFLGALVCWLALEAIFDARRLSRRLVAMRARDLGRAAAVAAAAFVIVGAPEANRLTDFFSVVEVSPSAAGGILRTDSGNLGAPIPPYTALGVWFKGDFREPPDSQFHAGVIAGLALLVAAGSVLWALRRRESVILAAAAACLAIYLQARGTESPYVSAKALAISSPIVMLLIVLAGLSLPRPRLALNDELLSFGLVSLFVGGAFLSSYLVFRDAQVGSQVHARELASLRATIRGASSLFWVRDPYASWNLRGARVVAPLVDRGTKGLRPEKPFPNEGPIDFDSFTERGLDGYEFAVSTRTAYESAAPRNWRVVASTPHYRLWERRGRTAARRIVGENGAPGGVLDCRTPIGRSLSHRFGRARVTPSPVVTAAGAWTVPYGTRSVPTPVDRYGFSLTPAGHTVGQRIDLPRGVWDVSLRYESPVKVRVSVGPKTATLPESLQTLGAYWGVARVSSNGKTPVQVSVRGEDPSFFREGRNVRLGEVAAMPEPRRARIVPLRRACGRYVDWYTVRRRAGNRRPVIGGSLQRASAGLARVRSGG